MDICNLTKNLIPKYRCNNDKSGENSHQEHECFISNIEKIVRGCQDANTDSDKYKVPWLQILEEFEGDDALEHPILENVEPFAKACCNVGAGHVFCIFAARLWGNMSLEEVGGIFVIFAKMVYEYATGDDEDTISRINEPRSYTHLMCIFAAELIYAGMDISDEIRGEIDNVFTKLFGLDPSGKVRQLAELVHFPFIEASLVIPIYSKYNEKDFSAYTNSSNSNIVNEFGEYDTDSITEITNYNKYVFKDIYNVFCGENSGLIRQYLRDNADKLNVNPAFKELILFKSNNIILLEQIYEETDVLFADFENLENILNELQMKYKFKEFMKQMDTTKTLIAQKEESYLEIYKSNSDKVINGELSFFLEQMDSDDMEYLIKIIELLDVISSKPYSIYFTQTHNFIVHIHQNETETDNNFITHKLELL